ncbi:MAG: recombinase family protein [Deltaproteobacteria bacterium]|nr:recombinase family protein [Deltaproteobacteria bacterium]
MKKIAVYARVSKNDESQDPQNQLTPLRDYAKAIGGEITSEYVDLASGGNGDRKEFLKMFNDADKRSFDLLLIWALDRFSREGISNTLGYLERFKRNGVAVKSLQEPWLDTRDEGIGQLLLAVFSWVAAQERKRIRERTLAGLKQAREAGKQLGRPTGSKDKKRRRKSGYNMRWATAKQSSPLKNEVSAV